MNSATQQRPFIVSQSTHSIHTLKLLVSSTSCLVTFDGPGQRSGTLTEFVEPTISQRPAILEEPGKNGYNKTHDLYVFEITGEYEQVQMKFKELCAHKLIEKDEEKEQEVNIDLKDIEIVRNRKGRKGFL